MPEQNVSLPRAAECNRKQFVECRHVPSIWTYASVIFQTRQYYLCFQKKHCLYFTTRKLERDSLQGSVVTGQGVTALSLKG